jgi:predicted nucleic acid-binding protein
LILDTNALSAFADGDQALAQLLSSERRFALPVIVLGEYRYGILQSRHRATYERWLADLLANVDVLHVTVDVAVTYANLRVLLKQAGRPIPANDAWIASIALHQRRPLVTRDAHFDAIPGLSRLAW